MIITLARNGELYLVSDGSAQDEVKSTFAVCMSLADMTICHVLAHKAEGTYDVNKTHMVVV